jgi:hypothetical protein
LIVAFGHRRRVGKDTATKILVEEFAKYGICAVRTSFADKLKEECQRLFGHAGLEGPEYYEEHSELKERVLPSLGLSPRDIWIQVGNRLRDVYPYVWIDLALARQEPGVQITIVSDMRYPNEVERVKKLGGKVVKITRQVAPVHDDEADSALADFDDWDMVIANNSGIESFTRGLQPIINIGVKAYADPRSKEQHTTCED